MCFAKTVQHFQDFKTRNVQKSIKITINGSASRRHGLILSQDVAVLHLKLLEAFLTPFHIMFDPFSMKKGQKSGDPENPIINYYIFPIYFP